MDNNLYPLFYVGEMKQTDVLNSFICTNTTIEGFETINSIYDGQKGVFDF